MSNVLPPFFGSQCICFSPRSDIIYFVVILIMQFIDCLLCTRCVVLVIFGHSMARPNFRLFLRKYGRRAMDPGVYLATL